MKSLLVLVLASVGLAQTTGQNVVTVTTLANTSVNSPNTYLSNPVQNIGQTNHTSIVTVAVAGFSFTASFNCEIQGSTDGVFYSAIGLSSTVIVTTSTTVTQTTRCYGYGAYPWIRTKLVVTPGGTVTFNQVYIGSSVPSNSLIELSAAASNMRTVLFPLSIGGGVATAFLPASSSSTQTLNIYGMAIFADSTATDVKFTCTTSGLVLGYGGNLGTTRSLIFPVAIRPYGSCGPGDASTYVYNGTASLTTVLVTYRYE